MSRRGVLYISRPQQEQTPTRAPRPSFFSYWEERLFLQRGAAVSSESHVAINSYWAGTVSFTGGVPEKGREDFQERVVYKNFMLWSSGGLLKVLSHIILLGITAEVCPLPSTVGVEAKAWASSEKPFQPADRAPLRVTSCPLGLGIHTHWPCCPNSCPRDTGQNGALQDFT